MSSPNGTPAKRGRVDGENGDSQTSSQPKTPSRASRGTSAAPQTPSQNALRTPNRNRKSANIRLSSFQLELTTFSVHRFPFDQVFCRKAMTRRHRYVWVHAATLEMQVFVLPIRMCQRHRASRRPVRCPPTCTCTTSI